MVGALPVGHRSGRRGGLLGRLGFWLQLIYFNEHFEGLWEGNANFNRWAYWVRVR